MYRYLLLIACYFGIFIAIPKLQANESDWFADAVTAQIDRSLPLASSNSPYERLLKRSSSRDRSNPVGLLREKSKYVNKSGTVSEILRLGEVQASQLFETDSSNNQIVVKNQIERAEKSINLSTPTPGQRLAKDKKQEHATQIEKSQPTDRRAATASTTEVNRDHRMMPRVEKSTSSDCLTNECLKLYRDPQTSQWVAEPKRINLIGSKPIWHVEVEDPQAPLLFVRNPQVVEWNPKTKQLLGSTVGQTELYVVSEQNMLIVPIVVSDVALKLESKPSQLKELKLPKELISLNPLSGLANNPDFRLASLGRTQDQAVQVKAFKAKQDELIQETKQKKNRYGVLKDIEFGEKNLVLQIIDERSRIEDRILYPVKNVTVSILGTNFQGKTDVRGIVEIPGVPGGSRFLVRVEDPLGQVVPHTFEIYADIKNSSQIEQLKVMTYRSLFLYSQVFQVTPRADMASVCMDTYSREGADLLTGIRVEINLEAEGPFYFNDFAPDPQAQAMGSNGRFCYFNVTPGLAELSFYEGSQYLTSVPVPLIGGSHLNDRIALWNGSSIELRLTAMPTALEQLYSDYDRYMTFHDLDYINLIGIGENEELMPKDRGLLYAEPGHTVYRGKSHFLSQAAEFEPVLYGFNSELMVELGHRFLAPMLPRGFVEDLFHELYLTENGLTEAFDSALGTVLVFHGYDANQIDNSNLKIRLINHQGQVVKDGWYFGSGADNLMKAAFFNLAPGIYEVLVEDNEGNWLDIETVPVDYWTSSFVQTGLPLVEY